LTLSQPLWRRSAGSPKTISLLKNRIHAIFPSGRPTFFSRAGEVAKGPMSKAAFLQPKRRVEGEAEFSDLNRL
jgi:hypothetical protein